jgi:hypothetical protein
MAWMLPCATFSGKQASTSPDLARTAADRAVFASGLDGRKDGENETLISPSETKRLACRGVSHWNPYGHRISHFPALFVLNDLTPFSFRCFRRHFHTALAYILVNDPGFESILGRSLNFTR